MTVWEQIWTTIQGEFADLPDAAGVTRLTCRLMVAAACGGVLGYERELRGKAAGIRTHMLVSLGAALFVLVPQQAGADQEALSRIVQGVVTGIGFLGAGAIVKGRDESHVGGLTTAAGIWMTSAIGITVGMGRDATALLSTFLAWAVLALLPHVAGTSGPVPVGFDDEKPRALRDEGANQPSDHV